MSAITPFRIFAAAALLAVVIIPSFHLSSGQFTLRLHHTPRLSSHDFALEALEHEVSDPFDINAISKLCLHRPKNPNVVIDCWPGNGGIGNVRSYVLHCVRMVLEVGSPMLLPTYLRRSKTDLAELNGPAADFEYFFDREHFVNTIETACPHIKVYDRLQEGWQMSDAVMPVDHLDVSKSTPQEPSAWRRRFDAWYQEFFAGKPGPIVMKCHDVGAGRAVMDDGMAFYQAFGRVLKFRPDVRRLAAACTAKIAEMVPMNASERIYKDAYMGAHLRTSSDAVKAGWPVSFEEQTDWYIGQALKHNLTLMYAAGGNDEDLARFAVKALRNGISVINKYDLLSGNDLRELKNLLWDQRGLIDFEVLLKASQFGGFARSSFAMNVAVRRHFLSDVEDPFKDPANHIADELSVVYGRYDPAWEAEAIRTMWP